MRLDRRTNIDELSRLFTASLYFNARKRKSGRSELEAHGLPSVSSLPFCDKIEGCQWSRTALRGGPFDFWGWGRVNFEKKFLASIILLCQKGIHSRIHQERQVTRGKISCIHVPRNTFYFIYKLSTMMLETANENECPSLRQTDSPSECMKTDRIWFVNSHDKLSVFAHVAGATKRRLN